MAEDGSTRANLQELHIGAKTVETYRRLLKKQEIFSVAERTKCSISMGRVIRMLSRIARKLHQDGTTFPGFSPSLNPSAGAKRDVIGHHKSRFGNHSSTSSPRDSSVTSPQWSTSISI